MNVYKLLLGFKLLQAMALLGGCCPCPFTC